MDIVLRVAALYFFLMIFLRALGKREFSQLSPFELVTLLLIPEIATDALTADDHSITGAVIGMSTLLFLVFITSMFAYRSARLGALLEGTPAVLVSDGRFVPEVMDRERVTADEVYGELRKVGYQAIEQIRWAVLEADGRISLIPWERTEGPAARRHHLPL